MNILYGININYGISLPLIVCPCWLLLFLPFKDALLGEKKSRRSRPLCPTRIASKSTLLCIDRLVSGAVEHTFFPILSHPIPSQLFLFYPRLVTAIETRIPDWYYNGFTLFLYSSSSRLIDS